MTVFYIYNTSQFKQPHFKLFMWLVATVLDNDAYKLGHIISLGVGVRVQSLDSMD